MKLLGVNERDLSTMDETFAKVLAGKKAWLLPVLSAMFQLNRPIIPLNKSCDVVIMTQLRDFKNENLASLTKQVTDVQQGRSERFVQKVVAVAGVPTVVTCNRRSFGFWNILTDVELTATREPFQTTITSPAGDFLYVCWIIPRKMPLSWIQLFPANSKGDVSPIATDDSSLTIPPDDIRAGAKLTVLNLNAQDI